MNARDISQILKQIVEASSSWSPALAGEVLDQLSALMPQASLDWDQGAGEAWCRVLHEGEPVVLLHLAVPVAFVRTSVDPSVRNALQASGVQTISTANWESREFRADTEVVKQVFHLSDWSPVVDPDAFSAAELWWMTL